MSRPAISVVCPFYNEEAILQGAAETMLRNLAPLGDSVELIVVDDGSTDGSHQIAEDIAAKNPLVGLIHYDVNQGRGYALKAGIDAARGEIIITTEIDLSWGDDIVSRLVTGMRATPAADMIIASPHLAGGGYKNVPAGRIAISHWGNRLLRFCVADSISMFTGMTRAYRAERIQNLLTYEKGKEFHLEVVLKAIAAGWAIREVPCVLEWKSHKLAKSPTRPARKSSTNLWRVAYSHLVFSFSANPSKYLMLAGALILVLSVLCFGAGVVRYFRGVVAIFLFLASGVLCLIGMSIFIFAVLARQNSAILAECWRLQGQLRAQEKVPTPLAALDPGPHRGGEGQGQHPRSAGN
jgi:dolichol-phosphate mannosyltransferase